MYVSSIKKCKTLTEINCTTYDFATDVCSTCASGYFTGSMCCADDKFFKDGSCVDISTIEKPFAKDCM